MEQQIIEKLKEQIDEDAQLNNDPNESNWVREDGRSFVLDKGEEVNGMLNIALRYLSDEPSANVKYCKDGKTVCDCMGLVCSK